MREIKFRAWDKKKKEWANLSASEMEFLRDGTLHVGESIEHGTHNEFNSFELMQFTGLLDKNGVEIYESDGIHTKRCSPAYWVVEFEYGQFRAVWRLPDGVIDATAELFSLQYSEYELTVVGNIYESPELPDHTDRVAKTFQDVMASGHGAEIAKGLEKK